MMVVVEEEGSPITLDFPEYIFSDAIKYRMNDVERCHVVDTKFITRPS